MCRCVDSGAPFVGKRRRLAKPQARGRALSRAVAELLSHNITSHLAA